MHVLIFLYLFQTPTPPIATSTDLGLVTEDSKWI